MTLELCSESKKLNASFENKVKEIKYLYQCREEDNRLPTIKNHREGKEKIKRGVRVV